MDQNIRGELVKKGFNEWNLILKNENKCKWAKVGECTSKVDEEEASEKNT